MAEVQRQIIKIFWQADANRTGSISMKELYDMLQSNGYEMTYEQFKTNFASFDEDGDNEISLHEYMKGMGLPEAEYRRYELYYRMFRKFDTSGSGSLGQAELSRAITDSGVAVSDHEAGVLLKALDNRNSGRVEYDEFIHFFFGVEIFN